ncbi:LacI family DNA-binding transcriptional regulator [Telmatospirillum siberiense]|nr:LacI family DNA-binding transcriptional regulator [Telmatospirillum siberiense]
MKNRPLADSDKTPTIKEVAKRARTSIATVSYVLNNKDRYLRPELRERVLLAAEELGYVKNAMASSLKGQRRGILAVLVPQFGNNFFTRICVEVEAIAQRAGFVVTICNSDENPAQERSILDRLLAQRIDGCILSPALSRSETAILLERHQVPCIILERTLDAATPDFDFVGHDNFQSGYLATRKLIEAGHRRIAFIGWDSPIPNIHDRKNGYLAAMGDCGLTPSDGWLHLDELTVEGGRRAAERLPFSEITALVIAHHHEMAKGTLLTLQERGISWPRDLSLVLIGTPEWHDLLRPSLACIQRPEEEMGRAAATLLLKKLHDPRHREPRSILPVTFLEGGSIRSIS